MIKTYVLLAPAQKRKSILISKGELHHFNWAGQGALFLPRPSSLQLGIEISGKTMGARGLMGMR